MLSDIFNKRNGRFVKFKFLITFELRKLSLYCNMYSTCKIVFHMFTLLFICVDWSTDLWALKINSVRTFVYRRSYHTHFSTFRDKCISIYVQQPKESFTRIFFFLKTHRSEWVWWSALFLEVPVITQTYDRLESQPKYVINSKYTQSKRISSCFWWRLVWTLP